MNQTNAPLGKASKTRKTFSQTVAVQTDIEAKPEVIWALLTNAADMSRWNSTILSLEGEIINGGKITLKSILDPNRDFKIKVRDVKEEESMIWYSGAAPFFKGERHFSLTMLANGLCRFSMSETMQGLMFPLAVRQMPDFTASFEQFAADLKKEAELIAN